MSETCESVGGRAASSQRIYLTSQAKLGSKLQYNKSQLRLDKSRGPSSIYFLLKLLFNLSPRVPPELPPSWFGFGSFWLTLLLVNGKLNEFFFLSLAGPFASLAPTSPRAPLASTSVSDMLEARLEDMRDVGAGPRPSEGVESEVVVITGAVVGTGQKPSLRMEVREALELRRD